MCKPSTYSTLCYAVLLLLCVILFCGIVLQRAERKQASKKQKMSKGGVSSRECALCGEWIVWCSALFGTRMCICICCYVQSVHIVGACVVWVLNAYLCYDICCSQTPVVQAEAHEIVQRTSVLQWFELSVRSEQRLRAHFHWIRVGQECQTVNIIVHAYCISCVVLLLLPRTYLFRNDLCTPRNYKMKVIRCWTSMCKILEPLFKIDYSNCVSFHSNFTILEIGYHRMNLSKWDNGA